MRTSKEDILRHRASGPWMRLESRAQALVEDARRHGGDSFQPILGGGTRLMLALNHRISDDVDLFVDSPGWLPYVSPRLNDILKAKLDGLDAALTHMLQRPSQRVAWDRIRTDRLADLDQAAAWAKSKVAEWADASATSVKATPPAYR